MATAEIERNDRQASEMESVFRDVRSVTLPHLICNTALRHKVNHQHQRAHWQIYSPAAHISWYVLLNETATNHSIPIAMSAC